MNKIVILILFIVQMHSQENKIISNNILSLKCKYALCYFTSIVGSCWYVKQSSLIPKLIKKLKNNSSAPAFIPVLQLGLILAINKTAFEGILLNLTADDTDDLHSMNKKIIPGLPFFFE